MHPTTSSLRRLVRVFLPDPLIHSLVTSLVVDVSLPDPEAKATGELQSSVLEIPLDRIPYVSTLTLKSCGRVSFSRQEPQGPSAMDRRSLREIQFHSCKDVDIKALLATIQSLKDVDAWDTLERVAVRKSDIVDRDAVLAAVGEERLRFVG